MKNTPEIPSNYRINSEFRSEIADIEWKIISHNSN